MEEGARTTLGDGWAALLSAEHVLLLHHFVGGAKKISESSLLERNSFSISGVVLNDASSAACEIAFHTEVLPAEWLKIGLHTRQGLEIISIHNALFTEPALDN